MKIGERSETKGRRIMSEKQSQAVAKVDRKELAAAADQIGELKTRYEKELAESRNGIVRAYVMGCAVIDLRQVVKKFLPVLKELMGTPLGFKTDLDTKGKAYPDEVIVECAIEAAINGAMWTGNEFNILFGGCFLTKNYWWRKITELPGIDDPKFLPGVPQLINGRACVEFEASWRINGKPGSIKRTVVVRPGQSDDQTIGKAEARMYKAVYRLITGGKMSGEADDLDTAIVDTPTRPAAIVARAPEPAEDEHAGEVFDWSAGKDAAPLEAVEVIR